jgi:hypothetical protein
VFICVTGAAFASDRPEAAEGWTEQPWTAFQIADGTRLLLDGVFPTSAPEPPPLLATAMENLPEEVRSGLEISGRRSMLSLLGILADPTSNHSLGPAMQPIRELLPELIERVPAVIKKLRRENDAG